MVDTDEGRACLVGDLVYDIEAALGDRPHSTPRAGVQSSVFAADEPAVTDNFTTSVRQELGAMKRIARYRFILPAHDAPGVLEQGRLVGRVRGGTVPGPITPPDLQH